MLLASPSSVKDNPSPLSLSQVSSSKLATILAVHPPPSQDQPVSTSVVSFPSLTPSQPTPSSYTGAAAVGVGVGVGLTLAVLALTAVIVITIVLVCCAVRR